MFDKQLEEFKQRVKLQTMKENEGKRDWEDVEKELTEKLETLTEIAQKIDADNIRLMKKNNELKIEFLSQENDRDLLIQQLLAEKKRYHKIQSKKEKLEPEGFKVKIEFEEKNKLAFEQSSAYGVNTISHMHGGGGGIGNMKTRLTSAKATLAGRISTAKGPRKPMGMGGFTSQQ